MGVANPTSKISLWTFPNFVLLESRAAFSSLRLKKRKRWKLETSIINSMPYSPRNVSRMNYLCMFMFNWQLISNKIITEKSQLSIYNCGPRELIVGLVANYFTKRKPRTSTINFSKLLRKVILKQLKNVDFERRWVKENQLEVIPICSLPFSTDPFKWQVFSKFTECIGQTFLIVELRVD